MMFLKILYLFIFISLMEVTGLGMPGFDSEFASAFDQELYERVIDEGKCNEQLEFLWNNTAVALQFQDASGKIPNGFFAGNLADLGDYHLCLGIKHVETNMDIEGKYCMIQYPLKLNQYNNTGSIEPPNMGLPDILNIFPNITDIFPNSTDIFSDNTDIFSNITDIFPDITDTFSLVGNRSIEDIKYRMTQRYAQMISDATQQVVSRGIPVKLGSFLNVSIGTCIPKVCRPKQAIQFFQQRYLWNAGLGLGDTNITYNELFCRLPNDKPLNVADYVAVGIFALISFVTVMSTSYDLYEIFVLNKKSSEINTLYRCFSVYTNTRKFLTFNKIPGALECVDGIRAISMLWVILGHVYCLSMLIYVQNLKATKEWLTAFSSTWVNSAPISVDTFFLLSGILCVYTVIGKVSQWRFVTSLHLFYLSRILRILPLLATVVLLQASLFHRMSDGPMWTNMAHFTVMCRQRWWAALLHVQNYIKPIGLCLYQTWYLSVDLQLYIFSPVVLVWLFGSRLVAWSALSAIILVSLTLTTTFSFLNNYSAALFNLGRMDEFRGYFVDYYMNPLTRAPPFFIGMMYGYLLLQCKGKIIRIRKILVCINWILAFLLMAFCIFSAYPIAQDDFNLQMFDNFLNSYMRGIWALAVGWLIFACVHGYGGPINWFLSLQMWKLPARLSYAMYLTHYPIVMIANGSMVNSLYFTDGNILYRAMANLVFTTIAALALSITIDVPCSTLQKLLLGGMKPPEKSKAESQEDIIAQDKDKEKSTL